MSFSFLSAGRHFPSRNEIRKVFNSFSHKEWFLFVILFILFIGSTLIMLMKINQSFMVTIPKRGGSYTEGIIGTPRYVNPILALSDADKDLVALVYSGLMRQTPEGELIPDLAEKYEVSTTGLEYTFTLRKNATFHDGTAVKAEDVVFTIDKAKDTLIKSPKKTNWNGVTVTAKDSQTVVFTLKSRYAAFLENTTLGILPAHIWSDLAPEQFSLSDLNITGIGSGPYMVHSIKKTNDGIPAYYELRAFKNFTLAKPYIETMWMQFYANEKELKNALLNGSVDAINELTPTETETLEGKGYTITTTPLPRVFGLYFNQTEAPIFTDKNVRKAISLIIDRRAIIDGVLSSYGTEIDSPLPAKLTTSAQELSSGELKPHFETDRAQAESLLKGSGWNKNDAGTWEKKDKKQTKTLSFSIATSDTPELKNASMLIKQELEAFGIIVEIKIFETGTLNQNIIRPRKYEALFFGQIVAHETDMFAFWHSSQRNDPGLNIALYTNTKVDSMLESASTLLDEDTRAKQYIKIEQEIKNDTPAVFVYSPDFIYIKRKAVPGQVIDHITTAASRFANVYQWYTQSEKVWKIFSPEIYN